MRIPTLVLGLSAAAAAAAGSCVHPVAVGPLGEGSSNYPSITAVDTTKPPKFVSVRMDHDAYLVVLLVAPGHSATLLYPADSTTDNRHAAGAFDLAINIPAHLARPDTAALREAQRAAQRSAVDTVMRYRNRQTGAPTPLPPNTPTYLLVITSPQPLSFRRVVEKTAGVSIPLIGTEALNAVGKAVKSTLTQEPREWAGFYQQITLTQAK